MKVGVGGLFFGAFQPADGPVQPNGNGFGRIAMLLEFAFEVGWRHSFFNKDKSFGMTH
jgi:hypothetical protein